MTTTDGVSVIGGGSWGTAIIKMLSENTGNITWWLRSDDSVNYIRENKRNPRYVTDVAIDLDKVRPTSDLQDAISSSRTIILAVPSAFLKDTLAKVDVELLQQKNFFSAIKGIIPDDLLIIGDYLSKVIGADLNNIGVITGPCHAEEVALEKLSYLTIACKDSSKADEMAGLLGCRYINTKTSDDIYGTEYSAVIKNVIAIASGICHGIGYGDNYQAVLISNAIQEIERFVENVHPITRDIKGSAYLGDLLVTAYSQFSRNRTFGSMIGKGYSVRSAQVEMNMVAEGYYAVKCIHEINKEKNVDMPICEAVYRILYEKMSPRLEMKLLSDILR